MTVTDAATAGQAAAAAAAHAVVAGMAELLEVCAAHKPTEIVVHAAAFADDDVDDDWL
jgi:hypothetical protein